MMLTDLLNYLPDDILAKVGRARMAVCLEASVSMLDHRVVEFAWKLPLLFRIRNGRSNLILRQVLYKYVTPELVERPDGIRCANRSVAEGTAGGLGGGSAACKKSRTA